MLVDGVRYDSAVMSTSPCTMRYTMLSLARSFRFCRVSSVSLIVRLRCHITPSHSTFLNLNSLLVISDNPNDIILFLITMSQCMIFSATAQPDPDLQLLFTNYVYMCIIPNVKRK